MISVSVIVPIYNVEPFIERCVRSLMLQTLESLEYIFVDDHGTDDSVDILMNVLNDYPQKKARVIIIHNEENLGQSLSRKKGFEASQGQYLIACDADDWVEPDAFQKLYEQVQKCNADIAVCDYIKELPNASQPWYFNLDTDAKKCLQQIHNNHRFSWTIWNQLIRREIILEAIQRVYPTTYAEDIYTMIHAYWLSNTVAHVKESLYHYNQCNAMSVMARAIWPKDIWLVQQKNIDSIVTLLNPSEQPEFALTCQWLKFKIKEKLVSSFPDLHTYYITYRESHRDILQYEYIPIDVRRKLRIIYSCYFTFWLYQQFLKYRNLGS